MKKIGIIANDVAMPGEKGLGRIYYLANLLSLNHFDVELITADFQHWEKEFRTEEQKNRAKQNASFQISFIHETAYTKNIDPKRIISYRRLSKNVKTHLEENSYDLIYALVPDNHLAAVCGKYAKDHGIPFIVDVEDLWPEAMRMVFDIPLVSDALFSYFTVNAKKAYSYADAVIGSSDEYRDEPLKYGIRIEKKQTVYVGNDVGLFDSSAAAFLDNVVKPEGEFWVTYAGTLGTSYDLSTFIAAADMIAKQGIGNIKYLILGDGPQRASLEEAAAKTCADIRFPGFLPFAEMAAYLVKSDLTLNSLVAKAPQSIVSKIGDYLAAGKPMINTGLNKEFCDKVNRDEFGRNVVPGNPSLLAETILHFYHSPEECERMGKKARQIAETQFDRPNTYLKIVDLIRSLL